jgi:hypothetical protein
VSGRSVKSSFEFLSWDIDFVGSILKKIKFEFLFPRENFLKLFFNYFEKKLEF